MIIRYCNYCNFVSFVIVKTFLLILFHSSWKISNCCDVPVKYFIYIWVTAMLRNVKFDFEKIKLHMQKYISTEKLHHWCCFDIIKASDCAKSLYKVFYPYLKDARLIVVLTKTLSNTSFYFLVHVFWIIDKAHHVERWALSVSYVPIILAMSCKMHAAQTLTTWLWTLLPILVFRSIDGLYRTGNKDKIELKNVLQWIQFNTVYSW